jgi:hypothetical protein
MMTWHLLVRIHGLLMRRHAFDDTLHPLGGDVTLEGDITLFFHYTFTCVDSLEDVFIFWYCIINLEAFLGVNLDLSTLYHGFDVFSGAFREVKHHGFLIYIS